MHGRKRRVVSCCDTEGLALHGRRQRQRNSTYQVIQGAFASGANQAPQLIHESLLHFAVTCSAGSSSAAIYATVIVTVDLVHRFAHELDNVQSVLFEYKIPKTGLGPSLAETDESFQLPRSNWYCISFAPAIGRVSEAAKMTTTEEWLAQGLYSKGGKRPKQPHRSSIK